MDYSFVGGIFVGLVVGGVAYAVKNVDKVLDAVLDVKHAVSGTEKPAPLRIFEAVPEKSQHGDYYWYMYEGKNYISLNDDPIKFNQDCIDNDVRIESIVYFDLDGEVVNMDESDHALVRGVIETLAGPGQNFQITPVPSLEAVKQNIPIIGGLLEVVHKILINTDDLEEHIIE